MKTAKYSMDAITANITRMGFNGHDARILAYHVRLSLKRNNSLFLKFGCKTFEDTSNNLKYDKYNLLSELSDRFDI